MVNLIQAGKTFLQGLLLAAACAPPPAFQAKQDYNTYPDYRGDIAFYNIEHILKENCWGSDFSINQERFRCKTFGVCLSYSGGYGGGPVQTSPTYTCTKGEEAYAHYSWKDIKSIDVVTTDLGFGCIKINGDQDCSILIRTRQEKELAEAIGIYVEELRKK